MPEKALLFVLIIIVLLAIAAWSSRHRPPYCEDTMTLIGILSSITLVIVIGVVVSEYLHQRHYRQGKAAGCTCPSAWVWRQDCPRHGWIEAGEEGLLIIEDEDEDHRLEVVETEGGGNALIVDNGFLTWIDLPERDTP